MKKVLTVIIMTILISIATVAFLSCTTDNEPIGYDPTPPKENKK